MIDDADQEVYVYLQKEPTGRIIRIEAESDSSGFVEVDITGHEGFFAPKFKYKMWITKRDADIEDKETITFEGYEMDECVSLSFKYIFADLDNIYELLNYISHTIVIA